MIGRITRMIGWREQHWDRRIQLRRPAAPIRHLGLVTADDLVPRCHPHQGVRASSPRRIAIQPVFEQSFRYLAKEPGQVPLRGLPSKRFGLIEKWMRSLQFGELGPSLRRIMSRRRRGMKLAGSG